MQRTRLSTAQRRTMIVVALLMLLGAIAWLSYAVAERVALRSLRDATVRRMDLYALNLGNEIDVREAERGNFGEDGGEVAGQRGGERGHGPGGFGNHE